MFDVLFVDVRHILDNFISQELVLEESRTFEKSSVPNGHTALAGLAFDQS